MRFKLVDVPFWALLFLPLFVAYNGYGVIATLFFIVLWALARLAIVQKNVMG